MRILIIEPHANGHHSSYLRWLVQAADRRRWDVVIATTADSLSHPTFSALPAEFANIRFHSMQGLNDINLQASHSLQLLRREWSYWKSIERAVHEIRMVTPLDFIVLPYVDYCFYALALLGTPFRGIPWCGISMRLSINGTGSAASTSMPWKWRMARRILGDSNLKALFVINPSVKDMPQSWYTPMLRSRVRYLPDPAEHAGGSSRHESRIALGISDRTVTILVFGSIDERKGIDALLGSLATERDLDDYTVILAGKQSESMRAQMHAPVCVQLRSQSRLIVLDRFVSSAEQGDLFAAADVVWVGYRNHVYMSGVLVLAGRATLPVIGTSSGEIGKLIEEHGIGVTARIDRPPEVTRALRTLQCKDVRETMGRKAQLIFAGHTIENFGTSVLNGLVSPNGD